MAQVVVDSGVMRDKARTLETEAGKIQTIRKYGQLLSEEYTGDGIAVKAYVPHEIVNKV